MLRLEQPTGGTAAAKPRRDRYDVVVIGAGMGGLTAGALLAAAGKAVLVVDANDSPGGYARSFADGPYTFDLADHLIMGCGSAGPLGPGLVDAVLRYAGVRDRCEFVRVDDPFYLASFPDFVMAGPGGRDEYLAAHLKHFPHEANGLRNLVDLTGRITRELTRFPIAPSLFDLLQTPWRFPTVFRYRNATLRQVIDRELTDPRLKAVYATLWAWIGLPPSRASFLMWALMMAYYIEDGAYYCRGGFQHMADALAEGLTRAGGELALGTRATRILADGGRVQGVVLDTAQHIQAPVVISNGDPRDTFEHLLDADSVPDTYRRRLHQMDLSFSAIALYVATDIDARALGAQHETVIATTWDAEGMVSESLAGRMSGIDMLIPSLTDPSLAPSGEQIVILKALAPGGLAQMAPAERDRLAEGLLELAEQALPGLRQHVTHIHGVEPGTTVQFPLDQLGPMYGWAVSPKQALAERLPQRTPVSGLYLVGQWTQPGHGILAVTQSGVQIARVLLGVSPRASVLPLLIPVAGLPESGLEGVGG